LIYVLLFSDGVKWIARFPGSGVAAFGPLERQRMTADLQTMRLIRAATTIPVPEVFAWSTTAAGGVGAPYALMAFIPGWPVAKRWFDPAWTASTKRLTLLHNLAAEMAKLLALRFDRIGALAFDDNGGFVGVAESVDTHLALDGSHFAPGAESTWGRAVAHGPHDTTRAYLLDDWDDDDTGSSSVAAWQKAELALVHLAIDSIPPALTPDDHFYLSPPDFDAQNVFVDDDGAVTGIIDWDAVQTAPLIGACARYPAWITRDWDPVVYRWPASATENSPAELSRFRRAYADAFAALGRPPAPLDAPDVTRLSHVFEAVALAAHSRFCRTGIVLKLLDHAFCGAVPFALGDFCDAYLASTAGEWMSQVRSAFGRMWRAEWDD
jgi:hypothetical protein